MKYTETPSQAADYLRQAIPLMVRHNIPPNPLNYALWYSYVSNQRPELNRALDTTLNTYGTCPNLLSEQLFYKHLMGNEERINEQAQTGLVRLIESLQEHTSQAAAHTDAYSGMLQDTLEALNGAYTDDSSPLPLESIVRNLTLNTEALNATTQRFQQQIDAAQAEIEALKQELNKTRQDARSDVLTGLYNRRVFDNELSQLIVGGAPNGLCLILIDVDHFKPFNDTYGHLMGDKVLQYVGRLLKDECQEKWLPVRFGGEEFAVILPGADLSTALALAEQLRRRVQAIRIRQKSSGSVISSITASFGVAEFREGDDEKRLIERADQALYKAKESGRNRVSHG